MALMATGSAKMTAGGAGGLAAYLMEERLVGYYADESGRPGQKVRSFGKDDPIFSADQVRGTALAQLKMDLSLDMTFGQFANLCEGRHPDTGERLVAPGYRVIRDPETGEKTGVEEAHTMAIDVYFSAPKEVSVTLIVANQVNAPLARAIVMAHEAAVQEASGYMQTESTLGRRTVATPSELALTGPRLVTKPGHDRQGEETKQQGSKSIRVPVDLITISATQFTARPNAITKAAGRMPDPHLHTHHVLMGPGYDPVTDKWVQIDDYGLKSTAVRRDADYKAALARNLEALGIELEYGNFEDGKGGRIAWRIKDISPEAVKFFSTNSERKATLQREMEDAAGGAVSEKVMQIAMREKRSRKDVAAKKQDSAPVFELWEEDAQRSGLDLAKLHEKLGERLAAIDVEQPAPVGQLTLPMAERKAEFFRRLYGPAGLNKDDAVFDSKATAEAISRCVEGLSFSPEDRLGLDFEVQQALVVSRAASNPAAVLYSTPTMLAAEAAVQAALAAKAQTGGHSHPSPANVAAAIDALGVDVDAEQLAAIRTATAGRGLTLIEGWAGTGKTTCLKAVVDAGRRPGSFGEASYDKVLVVSTANLTALGTGQKLGADGAYSIDSFVHRVNKGWIKPTARTLIVMDEAAMTNTWAMKKFLDAAGPAQLVLVGDSSQAQPIGPGGTFEAAKAAHGAVQLTKVWRQNDQRDVRDFGLLRAGRAEDVIDNLDARFRLHVYDTAAGRMNAAIRFYRTERDHGRGAHEVRIITDSSNRVVDEANRHIQRLRLNRGEIVADRAITVKADLCEDSDRRWNLHEGDLVILLTAVQDTDGKRIANGSTGRLVEVNVRCRGLKIALDDGRQVSVDASAAIGLAYAVHTQKFQGSEVPVLAYLPAGAGRTNQNTAYSSLTRCTEASHVFADRETHGDDPGMTLSKAWAKSPVKRTALSRQDARTIAPAVSTVDRRGRSAADRRQATYEARIRNVAGPDLAARIMAAPACPTLNRTLDDLRSKGADEIQMLRAALHQRQLITALDPAAVLVSRLKGMHQIAHDQGRSLAESIEKRSDAFEADLDPFASYERDREGSAEQPTPEKTHQPNMTMGMGSGFGF